MRSLKNIITLMLYEIPLEEEILRYELEEIKSSLLFTAPEMMTFRWNQCAAILNENIQRTDMDWEKEIQRIFAGKPKYKEVKPLM